MKISIIKLTDGTNVLCYESGEEVPVVLLHGLGASHIQPLSLFTNKIEGVKFLTYDQRLHGNTTSPPSSRKFSMISLVKDLREVLTAKGIERAIIGGISLGAAVAQAFALEEPQRVHALILIRPAIANKPNMENLQVFQVIADLLSREGVERAVQIFTRTPWYQQIAETEPATASSILQQFTHGHVVQNIIRLNAAATMQAFPSLQALATLQMETLIIANEQDSIHPYSLAQQISQYMDGARLVRVCSKNKDVTLHEKQVFKHVMTFINEQKKSYNKKNLE
jgi:pimeloyl-ACP methyl ester carboxylesterase